jgi:hypothetical protein
MRDTDGSVACPEAQRCEASLTSKTPIGRLSRAITDLRLRIAPRNVRRRNAVRVDKPVALARG